MHQHFEKTLTLFIIKKDFSTLVEFLECTTGCKWTILLHLHPNLWRKSNLLCIVINL